MADAANNGLKTALFAPRAPRAADTLAVVKLRLATTVLAVLALPVQAQGLPEPVLAAAAALVRDAALPLAPAGARIEATPGTPDPRLRLAPCARIEPYLPAGAAPWGRTRAGLRCRDGASAWNVTVPVTVKVFAPALVARQALAAGTVIDDTLLAPAVVDWAAERTPPFDKAAALHGRALARPLVAGQPLRAEDLRTRQWFAAGDTVRIDAVGAGFAVSSEGVAQSPGLEGQPVRVKTEGGRIVTGVARGERRVEITL